MITSQVRFELGSSEDKHNENIFLHEVPTVVVLFILIDCRTRKHEGLSIIGNASVLFFGLLVSTFSSFLRQELLLLIFFSGRKILRFYL